MKYIHAHKLETTPTLTLQAIWSHTTIYHHSHATKD